MQLENVINKLIRYLNKRTQELNGELQTKLSKIPNLVKFIFGIKNK